MKVIKHKDKWYLQSETGYKEILLSTNDSLIKDDVQSIDDEFLEFLVKNPSCDEVEVKTRYVHYYKTGETFISLSKTPEFSSRNMQCIKIEPRYEIIIPIVEPKQETHICKYCKAETSQSDDECYAKPKQEKLTYTESAKKEERISNSIMMKRKRETLKEIAKRYGIQVYKGKIEKEFDKKCITETLEKAADKLFPNAEQIGGETYTAYKGFIEGAKSDAAKNYWFKIFKKEFIVSLNGK